MGNDGHKLTLSDIKWKPLKTGFSLLQSLKIISPKIQMPIEAIIFLFAECFVFGCRCIYFKDIIS